MPVLGGGGVPYFLFVGRLHPVKAIHLLLRAFARLPEQTYRLIIAGPTQPQEQAYASSLRQLAADLGLGERVSFIGAVRGSEKWTLYQGAWAFILPSFSEGLSGVNLEAAACRCPVITTRESGMVAEWDACGGVFVHPEEESILSGLLQAGGWTAAERESRGKSLRALVERNYAWDVVGKQWASVYKRLAGEARHG
jgi:glycosyltransferase involved in cell wall biosynthesis